MRLYHGTNMQFADIDLQKSKPNKDFGKGFYLSTNKGQALAMAKVKTELMQTGEPHILEYEVDEQVMNMLRVLRFEEYSEAWARFVLLNRNNPKPDRTLHNYDVVIGPIADDRVGLQLWKYDNGMIDLKTLVEKLKYMRGITMLYFFGTPKAVSLLKRV